MEGCWIVIVKYIIGPLTFVLALALQLTAPPDVSLHADK